jgi:chondroitin 4-sulfotransferase 11
VKFPHCTFLFSDEPNNWTKDGHLPLVKPIPEAFIQYVIRKNKQINGFKINEHWRPQIATCPFCSFRYNVYGRYETLTEDTNYILLKSNQTNLLAVQSVNTDRNHAKKKLSRRKEFWNGVDARHLKTLHDAFKWDFMLFKY